MAIYVPTANNWHYFHFPAIGYVTNVHNHVQPPIIGYVSYPHDHVQSVVRYVSQKYALRYISWSLPPSGYIKINTDETFMHNSGLARYRGIVRDDKGRWLGGFVGRLGVVTTLCLTVPGHTWRADRGEELQLEERHHETNSCEVLMLTSKGGVVDNHPDRDMIEECRRLLFELGISMMHTLREGNRCADHLAKLGRMQLDEDLVILNRPPHSMHQLPLQE
ncbi:hypothetical protein H5410_050540 [Solanum commersonii]|uniref:RNase H type-1 domain-containing protein n=1 Tax=Solanum commersonii TaxID=4109 RepID=A0A9J5WVR3_SOLCO|nr:hypothetical protein H5410_050540 [Solanum commersonii]